MMVKSGVHKSKVLVAPRKGEEPRGFNTATFSLPMPQRGMETDPEGITSALKALTVSPLCHCTRPLRARAALLLQ